MSNQTSHTDLTITKAARAFIKRYGPLTKASAQKVAEMLQKGEVTYSSGITAHNAMEVMRLVDSISRIADPQRYETGSGAFEPGLGEKLLSNPALNEPHVMQAIANAAGPGEYANHVETFLNTKGSGQPDGSSHRDDPQTPQQAPQQPQEQAQILPTASGGGYQRVAQGGVITASERHRSPGQVHMRNDGQGGTYTSNISSRGVIRDGSGGE